MHGFQKRIAILYGIKAAILAQFLWEQAIANAEFIDNGNREWVRFSARILRGCLPYMTKHAIYKTLRLLMREKVIRRGYFNQCRFDHTPWYCFTDYGTRLLSGESGNG